MRRSLPASIPKQLLLGRGNAHNLGAGFAYSSLALGSVLALFLYPHAVTGCCHRPAAARSSATAIVLPAYSFALALIALLGFMAVAAAVKTMPEYAAGFDSFGNNFAVPALFLHMFPAWFAGLAFAAIAIGALVPASIMSIACGSLFTRNIYRDFIHPDCSPQREAQVAKIVAFVAKLGALFFVLALKSSYAIELQLLGGIWICQTVPAVLVALFTRALHPIALLIGWACGIAAGTAMAWSLGLQELDLCAAHFWRRRSLLCRVERAGAQSVVAWLLIVLTHVIFTTPAVMTTRASLRRPWAGADRRRRI